MVSLPCGDIDFRGKGRSALPYVLLAAATWLLDRLSKVLVVKRFPLWSSRPLVDHWLLLTHVRNTGAAFGLFQNHVLLLSLVGLGLLSTLYLFRQQIFGLGQWGKLGVALVVGGALGNLYDRLTLGYVVDFLELPHWPVFNLADSSVVLGVGLLLFGIWKMDRGESKNAHS